MPKRRMISKVTRPGSCSHPTRYAIWGGTADGTYPRPGPIQNWVLEEGLALQSDERYKEIRRWYARDKGGTMLRELMDLMTVPV